LTVALAVTLYTPAGVERDVDPLVAEFPTHEDQSTTKSIAAMKTSRALRRPAAGVPSTSAKDTTHIQDAGNDLGPPGPEFGNASGARATEAGAVVAKLTRNFEGVVPLMATEAGWAAHFEFGMLSVQASFAVPAAPAPRPRFRTPSHPSLRSLLHERQRDGIVERVRA
jgi:hypothetical protein